MRRGKNGFKRQLSSISQPALLVVAQGDSPEEESSWGVGYFKHWEEGQCGISPTWVGDGQLFSSL